MAGDTYLIGEQRTGNPRFGQDLLASRLLFEPLNTLADLSEQFCVAFPRRTYLGMVFQVTPR
jgi:hypothetical protein